MGGTGVSKQNQMAMEGSGGKQGEQLMGKGIFIGAKMKRGVLLVQSQVQ